MILFPIQPTTWALPNHNYAKHITTHNLPAGQSQFIFFVSPYDGAVVRVPRRTPPTWLLLRLAVNRQAGATEESISANACNTIGNGYTHQAFAIPERFLTYACYAIRDSYTRQAAATIERIIANACYTIRDSYTRKAIAIIERILVYFILFTVVCAR